MPKKPFTQNLGRTTVNPKAGWRINFNLDGNYIFITDENSLVVTWPNGDDKHHPGIVHLPEKITDLGDTKIRHVFATLIACTLGLEPCQLNDTTFELL